MRLIFASCGAGEAESLAETLLEERLIGCANLIGGARSLYWWQGDLCRDEEVLMLMETTAPCVEAATARLRELHSYDVPKIIVIDPERCDADYLRWLESVTGGPARGSTPI